MKSLRTLKFVPLEDARRSPIGLRRDTLAGHLEHQKALALNPAHQRTEYRWMIQPSGIKERVEYKKRVRPWWCQDDSGKVYLTVRYGSKAVEFEKGKRAILLPNPTDLPSVLDQLISAVRAGDLDPQLAEHAKARGIPRSRRASS